MSFVNGGTGTGMKIAPPQKKNGLVTSIFGAKIQTPPSFGRPVRGNEEEFREN